MISCQSGLQEHKKCKINGLFMKIMVPLQGVDDSKAADEDEEEALDEDMIKLYVTTMKNLETFQESFRIPQPYRVGIIDILTM